MAKKLGNTKESIIKEILAQILMVFILLIVMIPVLEVVVAATRVSQTVYGPHIGIFPVLDLNSWVDDTIANRTENKISKSDLKRRMLMAIDGRSDTEIMAYKEAGKNYTLETSDPELMNLRDSIITMINKKGKGETVDEFIEAFKTWEISGNEEHVSSAKKMLFQNNNYKMSYKYDIRTSLENFKTFFTGRIPDAPGSKYHYLLWFMNSLIVCGSVSVIQLIVIAIASYALSRFRFKGRKAGLMFILTVQVFPNTMAMVALYLLLTYIGGIAPFMGLDTRIGLILVYLGGGLPFNTWLVKGYFDTIPKELEESAMIDGATPWQAYVRIIVPLVRPILAVATIISFVGVYNEYVLANVLISDERNFTLPVGLYMLMNKQEGSRFGVFSAISFISAAPILVIWFLLQNHIVSGLTGGSVKG